MGFEPTIRFLRLAVESSVVFVMSQEVLIYHTPSVLT